MDNKKEIINSLAEMLTANFTDVLVLSDGGKYDVFEAKTVAEKVLNYLCEKIYFSQFVTTESFIQALSSELRDICQDPFEYWLLLLYIMDDEKEIGARFANPTVNDVLECGTERENQSSYFIQLVYNLGEKRMRIICDDTTYSDIKRYLPFMDDKWFKQHFDLNKSLDKSLALTTLKKLFKNKLIQ